MTLDRRKVLIYLRPDISASERFADAKIEAHHRGDRGDMSRTALLAGLALGEVDSRLPSMLAALLGLVLSILHVRGKVEADGPVRGLAIVQGLLCLFA